MIAILLSIKAFRLAVAIYALCLLYLVASSVATFVLVTLLFWRGAQWAIGRLSAPPRRRT